MSYMRTRGVRQALGDVCDPTDPAYDPTACTAGGGTPGVAGTGTSPASPSSGSSGNGVTTSTNPNDVQTTTATGEGWADVNGICYATSETLDLFKEFQRQLNRISKVIQAPLIAVDGAIGPNTLGAIGTINGSTITSGKLTALGYSSTSCDMTAMTLVGSGTSGIQALGDSLGAPSSVASPSGSPQVYNASTGTLQSQGAAASIADIWGNLSSTEQIGVAIGAGVLAYMAFGRKKTKPTTKALSRRY